MALKRILNFIIKEARQLKGVIYHRLYVAPAQEKETVSAFHKLYYDNLILGRTKFDMSWFGVPTIKCPLDLWIYQEIIFETKPDLIIETGTAEGGSALYLASLCDLINKGTVLSIDIKENRKRPQHKRIKYLLGSSVSGEIAEKVKSAIKENDRVMVILDSDHSKEHVLKELRIYSSWVSRGNYLIVEDSNVNGHPVSPEYGPGPMEAMEEFLKENKNFTVDKSREKFYMTFNPCGYLKRTG